MERSLIGILAPPWIPVPPPAYGGTEAVVAGLASGLARRRHEVRVVAAPGSALAGVDCRSVDDAPPARIGDEVAALRHALAAADHLADVDVLLDHAGPVATAVTATLGPPTFHVCHGSPQGALGDVYRRLARRIRGLHLVAISEAQRQLLPRDARTATCHNGIDPHATVLGTGQGGYAVFLGRMAPEKAPDAAIRIARLAGVPLRIAAKCREPEEQAYFDAHVRPLLGPDVEWLGEVGPADRWALLRDACALVFPITWPEPFGMVLVEALLAGTPVVARPLGAVPEIVAHGRTGFLHDDERALACALGDIARIDRAACRREVEERFSIAAMAAAYERVIIDARPAVLEAV